MAQAVVDIPVQGMFCVSCAAQIKAALKRMDGVSGVEVDFREGARVTYAPSRVSPAQMTAAINAQGYKAGTPIAVP